MTELMMKQSKIIPVGNFTKMDNEDIEMKQLLTELNEKMEYIIDKLE